MSLSSYLDQASHLNGIFSLDDLISSLLSSIPISLIPEVYHSLFHSGLSSETLSLQSAVSSLPSSLARVLFQLILSYQYLQEGFFFPDYYPTLLEATTNLIEFPLFEIEYFIDSLILKQLEINSFNSQNYDQLLLGYQFLSQISKITKNKFDIADQLLCMQDPIRAFLFEKINQLEIFEDEAEILQNFEEKEEKIRDIWRSVLKAESCGVDMEGFRTVFELFISEGKIAGRINQDFRFDEKFDNKLVDFDSLQGLKIKIAKENNEGSLSSENLFERIKIIDTVYLRKDAVEIRVYKCQVDGRQNEFLALKEITANNINDLVDFEQEANYLASLSGISRNFLTFYATRLKTVKIGNALRYKREILMEYVEKSLKSLKLERVQAGLGFNEDELKTIYEQLVESFNILKARNILHCDIKPSNVLITEDFVIKIIDFNIARSSFSDVTHVTSAFGTRDFMAPEIKKVIGSGVKASVKNDKADVFSLGMTILYLLVDRFESDLNDEYNKDKLRKMVQSVKIEYIKGPLSRMLEFDYNKRASLNELARVWAEQSTLSRTMDV